ncbi:acetyltransferase [Oscillochloris sp. ZM17-4]|uniref:acetyltransferase n=1 Tax=Oscillochloris sp. ZM17-4 TaxID=2866714 RepID=UPI001C735434|nr:acetyltransferase [Oscillochloris sp. ZM17-4]MBX0331338.1 acetyltransferase [Oscillochloris sp. ZM17-4]
MLQRRPFIVVGCGGFGKEVLWSAKKLNAAQPTYEILGYCDDDPAKRGQVIYGAPVLGSLEQVDAERSAKPCFLCAIGNNQIRARVVERVLALGWTPVSIIDPSVIVAEDAVVGVGTYVGEYSILCPNARVGNHVIINNLATVGHDAVLGDFAQISPGARVSGGSVLDEGAALGSNAVIVQYKRVGRYATLGACSFALANIPDGATAVGNPARVTFQRAASTAVN